jgi:hypothetical protein
MKSFTDILNEVLDPEDDVDADISKLYRTMDYTELVHAIMKIKGYGEEEAIAYYLKLKKQKE